MTASANARRNELTDLHRERIETVLTRLRAHAARSVLDLGCGPGPLLERMLADERLERVVGLDLSLSALQALKTRLAQARGVERLTLLHGSFTEPDPRLTGYDAAVMLETIEHIAPEGLSKVERAVFRQHRPRMVIITTPNVEHNVVFGLRPGRRRHRDHRFEWPRAKFSAWARGVAARSGYHASLAEIGWRHPIHGAPTQMAEFHRRGASIGAAPMTGT